MWLWLGGFQPHGARRVEILREKCRTWGRPVFKINSFLFISIILAQFSGSSDLPPWRTTFAEPYRRGPAAVGPAAVGHGGQNPIVVGS
jgi:hypothetical protein